METNPRWEVRITPTGDTPFGEARMEVTAYASDVCLGEVFVGVFKVAGLLSDPREARVRIPTVGEVQERARVAQVLQEHPAIKLFIRNGEQVWLSEGGLTEYLDETPGGFKPVQPGEPVEGTLTTVAKLLAACGWTDAGPAPAEVKRPCDYFLNEEALLAKIQA